AKTIADVAALLQQPETSLVKTLLVHGEADEEGKTSLVALVLRGDHQLNEIKAAKLEGVHSPLVFASEAEIQAQLGCSPGSIGPVGLKCPVIVDRDAAVLGDFVCGANE